MHVEQRILERSSTGFFHGGCANPILGWDSSQNILFLTSTSGPLKTNTPSHLELLVEDVRHPLRQRRPRELVPDCGQQPVPVHGRVPVEAAKEHGVDGRGRLQRERLAERQLVLVRVLLEWVCVCGYCNVELYRQ